MSVVTKHIKTQAIAAVTLTSCCADNLLETGCSGCNIIFSIYIESLIDVKRCAVDATWWCEH